jgi:hypothetical protein
MIEKTQKRLRQARFFYEHLLNPSKPNQGASLRVMARPSPVPP